MKHTPQQIEKEFSSSTAKVLAQSHQNKNFCTHRSFFSYVRTQIKGTGIYNAWQSLLTYLRRIRLLAVVLRAIALLFSLLQAGTALLLTTALTLILLPLLAIATLITLIAAAIASQKSNRVMRTLLRQKKVYVLFLPQKPSAFFAQTAQELAAQEDCAVILVSPHLLSGKGLYGRYAYCTVRSEAERIYLVRRYYFFSLKRRVPELSQARYLY